MNACDHPHGGGRGKSKGNKHPRSVYGWLTKGKRTRRSKDKDGNKMYVSFPLILHALVVPSQRGAGACKIGANEPHAQIILQAEGEKEG